jgi:glutaminyl-tRNA synthetase
VDAEVRLYDRLFTDENPEQDRQDFIENLNPTSLETLRSCKLETSLAQAAPGIVYQFERLGYFCPDPKGGASKNGNSKDAAPKEGGKGLPVFNRTVTLRDAWAKLAKKR